MTTEVSYAITYVRPDSDQLLFLFTGNKEGMTLPPMDFIRKTGIGNRNIVIFRDPHHSCYLKGLCDEYGSMDGIVAWQKEKLADRFSHVREIYCVGTSGGGGPAIYTAYHLRARAAWSFGGRIARLGKIQERDRHREDFHLETLGRKIPGRMTPEERARISMALEQPEVRELRRNLTEIPEKILDLEWIDRLAGRIRTDPVPTDFHLYYAPTNDVDRTFAEAFRDLPRACLHPVTPSWGDSPPPPRASLGAADHLVVNMLDSMGGLSAIFAPYLNHP